MPQKGALPFVGNFITVGKEAMDLITRHKPQEWWSMREEEKRRALIEEIETKLAKLLSAGHLTEEKKASVLKEILALSMNEETRSKEV